MQYIPRLVLTHHQLMEIIEVAENQVMHLNTNKVAENQVMHLNTNNKNVTTVEALSHTKVFVQQKEKLAINVRNQIISQKSADQEKRYIL